MDRCKCRDPDTVYDEVSVGTKKTATPTRKSIKKLTFICLMNFVNG